MFGKLNSEMMSREEISLQKSPLTKKEYGKVFSYYCEITLPSNIPDKFDLVFQNYYVNNLIIAQESTSGLTSLYEKKLMNLCFNEAEAYDWHSIPGASLLKKGLLKGKPLKLFLFQTTDIWNKIDIRNIKLVLPKSEENTAANQNRQDSSSLSMQLIDDLKILTEAAKTQSTLKPTAEYFYTPDENKRSIRRKDRKREMGPPK